MKCDGRSRGKPLARARPSAIVSAAVYIIDGRRSWRFVLCFLRRGTMCGPNVFTAQETLRHTIGGASCVDGHICSCVEDYTPLSCCCRENVLVKVRILG
ncbi:hypothetical protein Y032_0034g2950 [Ancylostoma ceylanicum]|uniref:Uncharacterized protein n=1 Tax=Ancylostoma ceylanicum TaxID=53326 RepID=A0A016UMC6_9BILA|nr:hypothetical protein Y032_0034g2950 [Ancylostoma ceylanicum]